VVWHAIDCDQFLFPITYDADDVFMELRFVFSFQKVLVSLHCMTWI
jgi:hypothetical protein